MIRTSQVRIYPNKHQARTLERWFVLACNVYNVALEQNLRRWHSEKKQFTYYEHQKELTELRQADPEYAAVPAQALRDSLRKLDRSYKAFFRRVKAGEKPGFPRFKQSKRWNSFEILQPDNYLKGNKVRIPNLGLVSCRGFRCIQGITRGICIIKRTGKWFAQLVVDDKLPAPAKRPIVTSVGIDVGLNSFATLSTGEAISNPRYYRQAEQKLKRASRSVSRKQKGSANRLKAIMFLAIQHERIKNLRKDFLHKLSRKIVNKYDLIAVENLQVSNMLRGRFSKSIADASWSTFTSMLEYKAENAGVRVVKVDPSYTSQDCSGCGNRVKKLISEREHICTQCGLVLDRDHNAALNILIRGKRMSACGETAEVRHLIEAGS